MRSIFRAMYIKTRLVKYHDWQTKTFVCQVINYIVLIVILNALEHIQPIFFTNVKTFFRINVVMPALNSTLNDHDVLPFISFKIKWHIYEWVWVLINIFHFFTVEIQSENTCFVCENQFFFCGFQIILEIKN